MFDWINSGKAPEPRKGMPSPRLGEGEFKRQFRAQFQDQAFTPLAQELEKIAHAAWDAYEHSRKSPHTRKAGPEFADPDYELSLDWIAAREAVKSAQQRHEDSAGPAPILLINCSSRSEHTCPSEMSKSFRLAEVAREVLVGVGGVEVEFLDLSRLASEYGRSIRCDLIGVGVELLGKLSQGSIALDGGKRHLRLESRCVVPARSSLHGRS